MSSIAASSYTAESPSGSSREKTVTNSVFRAFSYDRKWTLTYMYMYTLAEVHVYFVHGNKPD